MNYKTVPIIEGDTIKYFFREYRFLSNFYESLITVPGYFFKFPTVEHFYQSCKTVIKIEILGIVNAPTPGEAKKLGKKCTRREDWEAPVEIKNGLFIPYKVIVMKRGLEAKFNQHEDLRKRLLATGDMILEEGNDWGDFYWGKVNGIGENNLGKLLMDLREIYKKGD